MANQLNLPGIGGAALWASLTEKVTEQNLLTAAIAILFGVPAVEEIFKETDNALLKHPGNTLNMVTKLIGQAEKDIGAPIFQALVNAALGFNISDQSGQAAQAVTIVERAIGFSAALPMITSGISGVLESKLGNHAPREMLRGLRELGNDLGLNFFLGTVLAEIFDASAMMPIREAVQEQARPARLDYREIRALLKAHVLRDADANILLTRAGYRNEDIERLKQLDRVFLNTAELSNEFIHGRIADADLKEYLDTLGYDDTDKQRLRNQWIEQAQAGGIAPFRSVIRRGVLEGHLSVEQYAQALLQLQIPQQSIDLDVAAVRLELEWGRIIISVGQIKQFFQKGEYSDTQAAHELVVSGYDEATAQALLKDWSTEKAKTKAGIGIARILSYLLSGVISKPEALQMLMDANLSVQLATLLVTNPSQYGGLIKHDLTQSTLVAAYMEDVIDVETLKAKLAAIGVAAPEADYTVRVAISKKNRANKPKQAVKHLGEGQIIDALKYGTATAPWAVRELELVGYSEADSQLIVTTELTKLSGNVPDGWTPLT